MKRLNQILGLFLLLALPRCTVSAAKYSLSDSITGSKFYDYFNFENITDPVHGRVNYVDEATAKKLSLTRASDHEFEPAFIMKTDSTSVLDPNGPGRNTLRIRSKKAWTTHVSVYVFAPISEVAADDPYYASFDIRHMPEGCGTWPAVREKSPASNPNGGLVDVIEGVNDLTPNLITLHTTAGCIVPQNRTQTGTVVSTDCNAGSGCGVDVNPTQAGYGSGFNKRGGGWYAVERTPEFIKIWFWSRIDGNVPVDVRFASLGLKEVDTDKWGIPTANFPNNDQCDLAKNFSEHNIMLSLSLCGDWAGSAAAYPTTCPSTCVDNVNTNPSAFKSAYWDFAAIHVYT